MTAEIHLIHRDFKKELKSYGSGRLPSFAVGSLYPPHNDEVLFGGPPGGSMTETTNEVGLTADGLTVEKLMRAKAMLSANEPQHLVEWATPDMARFKWALVKDGRTRPRTQADLSEIVSEAFMGIPIVLDEDLPADVFCEARDQHGNSLGRIMAS